MAAEVDFLLSGGNLNTDPQVSLGGGKSATLVDNTAEQNLFANVSTAEALSGSDKYRCVYIQPPAKSYTDMGVWISTPTPANSSRIFLAVAAEGKNADAELLADEDTPPASVVFTRPVANYQKITLPDLGPGEYIGLWIKRTISAEAQGFDNDYARITVEGVEV